MEAARGNLQQKPAQKIIVAAYRQDTEGDDQAQRRGNPKGAPIEPQTGSILISRAVCDRRLGCRNISTSDEPSISRKRKGTTSKGVGDSTRNPVKVPNWLLAWNRFSAMAVGEAAQNWSADELHRRIGCALSRVLGTAQQRRRLPRRRHQGDNPCPREGRSIRLRISAGSS